MFLVSALGLVLALPASQPDDVAHARVEATARAPVTVLVFDEAGAPLPGVEILASPAATAPVAVTDDVGGATFPGRAVVFLRAPGQAAVRVELTVGVTDHVVDLGPTGASVRGLDPADRAVAEVDVRASVEATAQAWLHGAVTGEDGTPLGGVRVLVEGVPDAATTDDQGRFRVKVPTGQRRVSFIEADHATLEQQVDIGPAGHDLDVEMVKAGARLAAVTVHAPHIAGSLSSALDERKNENAVTEVLSREEFKKTGDGDAAKALSRVTGLSVVGGRYVYVRGLGERYASSRLNGAALPSPEPERRVVPLDLFPTALLESITVKKSYSPELPGEFGGGVVELKTRSIPETLVARVSLSTGARSGTTFSLAPHSPLGLLDPLGLDVARGLPGPVAAASADEALLQKDRFSSRGYTAEELETFGEMMNNVYSPVDQLVLPDGGFSAEVGGGTAVGPLKLGGLFGTTFKNSAARQAFTRDYFVLGEGKQLEDGHRYTFDTFNRRVTGGAIATLGASLYDDHKATATFMLGRVTDNEARWYEGHNRDVGGDIRVSRLRFVERTLALSQFAVESRVPALWNLTFNAHYTYALAARHEPDRRETRYDREGTSDRWRLSDRPEGNQRVFSDLLDHSHNVETSLKSKFPVWLDQWGLVQGGLSFAYKTRVVDTRRFKFLHKGEKSGDSQILSKAPEQIFTPANIGSDGFQLEEITRQTDNYDASQLVVGAFSRGELPIAFGLLLYGGLRLEHGRQNVRTYALFNPDNEPVIADLVTTDLLPSVGAVWTIMDTVKIRTDGNVTLSRPDFRELSPATFNDVTGGRQIFGNPDLERALIIATDARVEWYPVALTQLSLGAFYKHFHRPIEQVVVVSAQQSVTYMNADAADNVGVEVEARTDFGFVHDLLEGLYVAGNAALIYSRVDLGDDFGIATAQTRPLQGQSPYLLNLQTGYQSPTQGTRLSVAYNLTGPKITDVGAQGAPDIIEDPIHRLDVLVSQPLGAGFSVGVSVKNVLNLPITHRQGERTIDQIQTGRQYGASLSWAY